VTANATSFEQPAPKNKSGAPKKFHYDRLNNTLLPESPMAFAVACDPGYKPGELHAVLSSFIAASLLQGRARLILNVPPRAGKSRLISIETALWWMLQRPVSVVCASYSADLATAHSRQARDRFASDILPALSTVRLKSGDAAAHHWTLTNGSSYKAVGVGGSLTGHGADLLILDDLHKDAAQASSPAIRQNVWDWFTAVAFTRLSPDASVILIGTRWHQDDITGRLLALHPSPWLHINLPACAAPGDFLARLPGEPLWPERFGPDYFPALRRTLSKYFWAALYEGAPIHGAGAHLDIDRFHIVDLPDVPSSGRFVRYWDLAVTQKRQSDFTAGALCALHGQTLWIIDIASGQWQWPDARSHIVSLSLIDRCQVGIESVATAAGLVQNLREVFPPGLLLTPTTPDKDKLTRALPWFAKVNAGLVRLVRGHWNNKFLGECLAFPNGPHDDTIDAVSGAAHLLLTPTPGNILPFAQSPFPHRERTLHA
jgi:predicted phage terminase large subunit-like protein